MNQNTKTGDKAMVILESLGSILRSITSVQKREQITLRYGSRIGYQKGRKSIQKQRVNWEHIDQESKERKPNGRDRKKQRNQAAFVKKLLFFIPSKVVRGGGGKENYEMEKHRYKILSISFDKLYEIFKSLNVVCIWWHWMLQQ